MKATAEARALANPTPTRRRRATPATARPPPQRPRRRRRVYASSSSSDVSTDAEQDDMYEEEDDEEEEIVQQPSEVLHQEGGVTPVCNVGGEKVQQDIQPAGCVELCSAIKDDAHGVLVCVDDVCRRCVLRCVNFSTHSRCHPNHAPPACQQHHQPHATPPRCTDPDYTRRPLHPASHFELQFP